MEVGKEKGMMGTPAAAIACVAVAAAGDGGRWAKPLLLADCRR